MPILIALAAGLALGLVGMGRSWAGQGLAIAEPVGGMWLDGLKMTIVPLVVSLLITGIIKAAAAARAGRLALRSVITFLVLLWASSLMAALVMPLLFNLWPLSAEAAQALQTSGAPSGPLGAAPGVGDFLRSFIPSNLIAAAASDAILPLTVFTIIFAFALLSLEAEKRDLLAKLFEALGDAMLVVIGWVLRLAPIGVFALAFSVAAKAGISALGALAHYVVLVSATGGVVLLAAYGVAMVGGRIGLGQFARAVLPAQAVAVSTQSSLASLPAMLGSCAALGIPAARADLILPLAVALFRATGPAMNLAVALYIAHWTGAEPGWMQIAAAIAVAATTTLGAVSLPGQLSFVSSIAPIALVLGVPVEPLGLLIAVETLPDIMRTLANVTMDVAVTATISRQTEGDDAA
ncbi:MAG TPA: cation:dicarboxylase symporter family transporter [Chakrabartia sp.]|jgi:Na+/H+-dicarboxylate symporter|nr:cation:dicarboxylase symporter family transporter [Chakrabartia sp.]